MVKLAKPRDNRLRDPLELIVYCLAQKFAIKNELISDFGLDLIDHLEDSLALYYCRLDVRVSALEVIRQRAQSPLLLQIGLPLLLQQLLSLLLILLIKSRFSFFHKLLKFIDF